MVGGQAEVSGVVAQHRHQPPATGRLDQRRRRATTSRQGPTTTRPTTVDLLKRDFTGALPPPQVLNYSASSMEEFDALSDQPRPERYNRRYGNTTQAQLERVMAVIEKGESALASASGLGVATTACPRCCPRHTGSRQRNPARTGQRPRLGFDRKDDPQPRNTAACATAQARI